jgi:hypothetical protein
VVSTNHINIGTSEGLKGDGPISFCSRRKGNGYLNCKREEEEGGGGGGGEEEESRGRIQEFDSFQGHRVLSALLSHDRV